MHKILYLQGGAVELYLKKMVFGQLPEWTQSRKTPSRRTQSRMNTIPNGHNPEWTQSRMSTYLVTEVFYTQAW